MKNTIFAIALLFTVAAKAQTSDPTKLKATITICEKDPQKVTVVINNPRNEKLTIDVSSADYGSILSKTVQSSEFRTNFDFSTVADGDYTIEVSCRGAERIRKTIRMETKEVVVRSALLK